MEPSTPKFQDDYSKKIKGLIFFRALFAFLLLGSTLVYGFQRITIESVPSFLILVGLCVGILLLSVVYYILYRNRYVRHADWFAYIQLCIDSLVITAIVYITGSFISFFTFLYLIVIICSSMLLFKKGSMILAMFCSLQYGAMILLEYRGILFPIDADIELTAANAEPVQVLFKVVVTIVACFAVAFLSSLLAEQEKKIKKELMDMRRMSKELKKAQPSVKWPRVLLMKSRTRWRRFPVPFSFYGKRFDMTPSMTNS